MILPVFLGVDPGLRGAIATYSAHNGAVRVWDIPTHEVSVRGKPRKRLDGHGLAAVLAEATAGVKVQLAAIEDVHSMPAQGVASAFTFGFVAGAIQQAVIDSRVSYAPVDPARWKRFLRVPANKDGARARASQLLPAGADQWRAKGHDGRAEAALLAYYASLVYAATFG